MCGHTDLVDNFGHLRFQILHFLLRFDDGAAAQSGQTGRQQEYRTLYLRVARTGQKGEQKILPILKMFPGRLKTVIYYADTGVRLAGTCEPQEIMLQELRGLLGEENVVLK